MRLLPLTCPTRLHARQCTPEGCLLHSPGVEARSAEDPGLPEIRLIYTTPIGCRSLGRSSMKTDPWRGRGGRGPTDFPGSSGLRPSDTRAMKNAPLRGASPTRPIEPRSSGRAPLRGARSIGIGHPRSGDRCIAPHPSTTTPPGCRRAEPHFPATPGGVVAYRVCLYIGRRHFVPRPMPMERASYGCRREPGRESRRESRRGRAGGEGRAGEGSQAAQTECHHTCRGGRAEEGEPEGESRGGEPGREGQVYTQRRPTRPTRPIESSLTRERPHKKKAPHPVSRQSGEPPPRCLWKSFVVAHRYPFPEASHRIEPPPHPEGGGIPAASPRDTIFI